MPNVTPAPRARPAQLVLDLAPPAAPTRGKRWDARRPRWVAPRDVPVFRPAGWAVDVLEYTRAKRFVTAEHYSASMPATYTAVGLFRSTGGRGAQLAGVAVFSVPTGGPASMHRYLGVAADEGCDLGRFVLRHEAPFNAESWFLARALGCLRAARPAMRGVVSYADPLAWVDGAGRVLKSAHWGQVYAASASVYAGRATARTLVLAPDGRPLNGRNLTKIRKQERGWEYAAAQLLVLGAPARARGETPGAWVARVLASPAFRRRVRHPGNHTYLFALDAAQRRDLRARHAGAPRVPKPALGRA